MSISRLRGGGGPAAGYRTWRTLVAYERPYGPPARVKWSRARRRRRRSPDWRYGAAIILLAIVAAAIVVAFR